MQAAAWHETLPMKRVGVPPRRRPLLAVAEPGKTKRKSGLTKSSNEPFRGRKPRQRVRENGAQTPSSASDQRANGETAATESLEKLLLLVVVLATVMAMIMVMAGMDSHGTNG